MILMFLSFHYINLIPSLFFFYLIYVVFLNWTVFFCKLSFSDASWKDTCTESSSTLEVQNDWSDFNIPLILLFSLILLYEAWSLLLSNEL